MNESKQLAANSSERTKPGSGDGVLRLALFLSLALIGVAATEMIRWHLWHPSELSKPYLAGVYGDFLSGVLGPILSLVSIYLVVLTLREQRNTTKDERHAEEISGFENRFLELLKLHRDNVEELEIKGVRGRKAFVFMIREWRCILNITRRQAQQSGQALTRLQLIEISYYCLFYGVGPNSSRLLREYLKSYDPVFVNLLESLLSDPQLQSAVEKHRRLGYIPFEGHQSRLGHYYRHLFQMVRFVEKSSPKGVEVTEYMRTIRAQLSTHEQALLLLNSLTPMGAAWWNKHLIDDHCLVHNLPAKFFDPSYELEPTDLFEEGYFEVAEAHDKPLRGLDKPFTRAQIRLVEIWKEPLP